MSIGLALAMLAPLVGCAQGLTAEQQMLLTRGEEAYEQQRYAESVSQLSQFLTVTPPERDEVGRALYVRGMSFAKSGRRNDAYRDLRRVVATMGDIDVVWRSYFVLGTMYYEDRDWDEATVMLRAATYRMPAEPPKDFALFRLGECYERLGRWQDARAPYREVVEGYAGGSYGPRAAQKLARNATHYSVQAGSFSVESNAQNLVKRLRDQNLPAFVRREYYNKTLRYVVLVGEYTKYDAAERMVATVKAETGDALVWP